MYIKFYQSKLSKLSEVVMFSALSTRRYPRMLLSILAAGLLVGACGGSDEPLLIYSGRGEELVGPLIEEFRNSSGLEVEVRYAGSTELASTLLEEGSGTEADVFPCPGPCVPGACGAASGNPPLGGDRGGAPSVPGPGPSLGWCFGADPDRRLRPGPGPGERPARRHR